MRTNVVIDDELMAKAMALTGLTTKRAVIEESLRVLIQLQEQMEIGELYGQLRWEGDLNAMREDRFDYSD